MLRSLLQVSRLVGKTHLACRYFCVPHSTHFPSVQATTRTLEYNWDVKGYAKKSDLNKKQQQQHGSPRDEDSISRSDFDTTAYERSLTQALDLYKKELSGLRTGRASPGLLEPIEVDIQGVKRSLSACAAVSVRNPQQLTVSVFDATTVGLVAKAIKESPLSLESREEGDEIIVSIPRPTKQVIDNMIKLASQEAEKCRVAIRQARQKTMDKVKKWAPSDDEKKRMEKEVQKRYDKALEDVDAAKAAREKDLRSNL